MSIYLAFVLYPWRSEPFACSAMTKSGVAQRDADASASVVERACMNCWPMEIASRNKPMDRFQICEHTSIHMYIYIYIYVFWARIVNASLQCKFQHFFVTSWLTLWAGMEKGSYRSWLPGHMYICIYTFTFVYAWMRGALVVVHAWMLGSKLSVLHHGGRKRRSRAALLNTGRAHSGLAHPGSAWSWVGQKHKTQAWRKN